MKQRKITSIIIHCTASPNSRDIGVKEITQWHKERGFATIGYHFVIKRDGRVEKGRPVDQAGAHCFGHNANSIGICLVGMDRFTSAQIDSLVVGVARLKTQYKLKDTAVFGHYEFDKGKTCPNLPMDKIRGLFVSPSTALVEVLKQAGKMVDK